MQPLYLTSWSKFTLLTGNWANVAKCLFFVLPMICLLETQNSHEVVSDLSITISTCNRRHFCVLACQRVKHALTLLQVHKRELIWNAGLCCDGQLMDSIWGRNYFSLGANCFVQPDILITFATPGPEMWDQQERFELHLGQVSLSPMETWNFSIAHLCRRR